jgi:hypothetical protein
MAQDIRADASRMANSGDTYYGDEVRGAGLLGFAALMLVLVGTFNVLEGLLAIADSRVYTEESTFVFSNLNSWGWIMLLLGAAQLLAALGIAAGNEFARWFGIAAAFVNALGQLFFMPAYPLWAITMLAVDIVIIYALAVYAGKRMRIG